MQITSLRKIWESIADRGGEILAARRGAQLERSLESLCRDLLSERGEASGLALARELVRRFETMNHDERLAFFSLLEKKFSPDIDAVLRATEDFRNSPEPATLRALNQVVESPRQELVRRLNMAPNGTGAIVEMRHALLAMLAEHPELQFVDTDFEHLLRSWFNRGFLESRRIDWHTPAFVLEKLFKYEAVHEIQGWSDMHRRLKRDRRCFAFFHPALPDEPLIFVEVALVEGLAHSIEPLLDPASPPQDPDRADTAIFYSISNCQGGLRGISFGSFLIKQVVEELAAELPKLKTFATLSPLPAFRRWLAKDELRIKLDISAEQFALLDAPGWERDQAAVATLKDPLLRACAHYLLKAKKDKEPLDPVARFHLGNGASIERINWLANRAQLGLDQSAGLMVNYNYRPKQIEGNHEAFVNRGKIAASSAVRSLLRS
jgi:malonyl-CoA decarboxylase